MLSGTTLAARLAEGPLALEDADEIIADALATPGAASDLQKLEHAIEGRGKDPEAVAVRITAQLVDPASDESL